MARNAEVSLTADTWTQLTADNASVVALSIERNETIKIMATVDTTAPTGTAVMAALGLTWVDVG